MASFKTMKLEVEAITFLQLKPSNHTTYCASDERKFDKLLASDKTLVLRELSGILLFDYLENDVWKSSSFSLLLNGIVVRPTMATFFQQNLLILFQDDGLCWCVGNISLDSMRSPMVT